MLEIVHVEETHAETEKPAAGIPPKGEGSVPVTFKKKSSRIR